jgi:hypothetical protein
VLLVVMAVAAVGNRQRYSLVEKLEKNLGLPAMQQ